jgi:hypothetical protein
MLLHMGMYMTAGGQAHADAEAAEHLGDELEFAELQKAWTCQATATW